MIAKEKGAQELNFFGYFLEIAVGP